ncbi:lipopolysaccharide biosynthesis protein [Eubacterium sp.]|uniref:lipopolysaccharide biosynthesis protein n=1 Tax=Eubacterium sp. TaxID=142586 RepID=UPI00258B1C61|nr:lipopolysaccharide biosynthesis protein [Eubacterium sp.]MCR5367301.1 lipopolysaccharide biosynthesis protein [Eubacterium sp.]
MKLLRKFITESKDVSRSAGLWNLVACANLAIQPVLLMMIISRLMGAKGAAMSFFTLGNTYSNLFLTIGKFGTRGYQVSDVKREFSFSEYRVFRLMCTIAMMLSAGGYIIYMTFDRSFTMYKMIILLLICLYRVPDSWEDVYFGEYQKEGRLDIASKAMVTRMVLSLIVLLIMIFITNDLLISYAVAAGFNFFLLFWCIAITKNIIPEYREKTKTDVKMLNIRKIFFATLPLALVGFITQFISTVPKDAIDKYMDPASVNTFNYIQMPIFIVSLLIQVILNPIYYKYSCLWNDKELKKFHSNFLKITLFNIGITLFGMVCAYFLGIPVISLLYNTSLPGQRFNLMIIVVCSGLLGLVSVISSFLTIMRRQKMILMGHIIAAISAYLFVDNAVSKNGIRGATFLYLGVLSVLSIVLLIGYIVAMIATKNKILAED